MIEIISKWLLEKQLCPNKETADHMAQGLFSEIRNELELMNIALTVIQAFPKRLKKIISTMQTYDEKAEWELAERIETAIMNYLEMKK